MAFLDLLGVAQLAEQFQSVYAGVVAVGPDDLIGVMAAGQHLRRLRRAHDVLVAQKLERVGRLLPGLITGGAGAVLAESLPGDERAGPVGPVDGEAVALAAQG